MIFLHEFPVVYKFGGKKSDQKFVERKADLNVLQSPLKRIREGFENNSNPQLTTVYNSYLLGWK